MPAASRHSSRRTGCRNVADVRDSSLPCEVRFEPKPANLQPSARASTKVKELNTSQNMPFAGDGARRISAPNNWRRRLRRCATLSLLVGTLKQATGIFQKKPARVTLHRGATLFRTEQSGTQRRCAKSLP